MANESTLNKTFNRFKVYGTVSEMGMLEKKGDKWENVPLRIVHTTRDKYVDGQKTEEKIPCEQLRGEITLKVGNGLQRFRVNFSSKKANGEDDKRWEMAKKIMDWVPAIGTPKDKEGMEPSYVTMQGDISIYDNVGKDGKVYSSLQYTGTAKCQRANVDDPSGCSLNANALLANFRPEMTTGEDPEETGRLLVTLYAADNHGQCFPIECIVPVTIKDDDGSDIEMASVFGDCFEVGQTLSCEFNRVVRHIGGNGKKKKAFGKSADIAVSNGYDIEELILVGADTIDEPAELTREDANGNEVPVETDWINPEAMK